MQEFMPLVEVSRQAVEYATQLGHKTVQYATQLELKLENDHRARGFLGRLAAGTFSLSLLLAGNVSAPPERAATAQEICIENPQCPPELAAALSAAEASAKEEVPVKRPARKKKYTLPRTHHPIERAIDEMDLTLSGFVAYVDARDESYMDDAKKRTSFNPKVFNHNGRGIKVPQGPELEYVTLHHTADTYNWELGQSVAMRRLLDYMNKKNPNPRDRRPMTIDACCGFNELVSPNEGNRPATPATLAGTDAQSFIFASQKVRLAGAGSPKVNSETYNIEGEALDEDRMTTDVLEGMIYSGTRVLQLEGELDPNEVEEQWKGHAELKPREKVDFPKPVMDYLRRKKIEPFLKANFKQLKKLDLTKRQITLPRIIPS